MYVLVKKEVMSSHTKSDTAVCRLGDQLTKYDPVNGNTINQSVFT